MDHARDLLKAARAVQAVGKPHIAYHLATLALEELGRKELIAVESIASGRPIPPAWPGKHTQDHVKKLFWAFFGGSFVNQRITPQALDEMQRLAQLIHTKRIAGLYVESCEDGLNVPSAAIDAEDCEGILGLATTRLEMAASEVLPSDVSDEDREVQGWFLSVADDPEQRQYIFGGPSMAKLAELKNARAWVGWLKEQFEKADQDARAAIESEMRRSQNLPQARTKDKWKLRVRIFSGSHSIRPKTLSVWNEKSDWIKLLPISGKKNQLILEFILGDNVPVQGLWFFGWGLARHLVVALNIGTLGFWWWRMPEQISRYYESLEDLEGNRHVVVERNPSLKIDWGENRVLTEGDLARVSACFAALPGPDRRDKHAAYNYYIGGITFLSLNDVHWQCELQAYGNFHESLKAMMRDASDWDEATPFDIHFAKFLDEKFPESEERQRLLDICCALEAKNPAGRTITLKEVAIIKILCDTYFLGSVAPAALKDLPHAAAPDVEAE